MSAILELRQRPPRNFARLLLLCATLATASAMSAGSAAAAIRDRPVQPRDCAHGDSVRSRYVGTG